MTKVFSLCAAVLMLAALCGCDVLGRGTQPALYTLPKGKRVLVFVDIRAGTDVPADVPATLGKQITDHLYQFRAADNFVGQQKLTDLRVNTDAFAKLAIEDVARQTGADVVIFVDLIEFYAKPVSEGQLTMGQAQALVKVVDGAGNRLWPIGADIPGASVASVVPEKLAEDQTLAQVRQVLLNDLTARIGRGFHEYDKEDRAVAR